MRWCWPSITGVCCCSARWGREEAAEGAVGRAFAYIQQACEGLRRHSGAVPIVQTLAPPPKALFGALDRIVPGSPFDLVQRLNRRLAAIFTGAEGLLLDVARARRDGRDCQLVRSGPLESGQGARDADP
jgi:hypothetical protein